MQGPLWFLKFSFPNDLFVLSFSGSPRLGIVVHSSPSLVMEPSRHVNSVISSCECVCCYQLVAFCYPTVEDETQFANSKSGRLLTTLLRDDRLVVPCNPDRTPDFARALHIDDKSLHAYSKCLSVVNVTPSVRRYGYWTVIVRYDQKRFWILDAEQSTIVVLRMQLKKLCMPVSFALSLSS